jgi:hypothetical protein
MLNGWLLIFAGMKLTEVLTRSDEKEFLELNVRVNQGNPAYIRPLNKDITEVFNPEKNKTFRFGKVIRWLLRDHSGKCIGRIAAFTNKKYKNKGDDVPVGGIGFFDCINEQLAANTLFDTAKSWLSQQGMEAMDGPINFGERDRWWGLVVEGFQSPLYCMNYNPPYYQKLFEEYGFCPFFHQICLGKQPKAILNAKILDRHAAISKDPLFSLRNIRKDQLPRFAADFAKVYNAAWAGHGGLKELKKEQVMVMFNKMKPVMDERVIWYAYYGEEPIAIFINLPDLNQWFRHLNGGFSIFHKLKFLWVKNTKSCTKFTGIVFGIVPEYQGKGIDAFIIGEAYKTVIKTDYSEYEMQWIGDFNPKMLNVAYSMGDVYQSRMLTTYRYLFDRNKEFKRHPIL